MLVKLQPISGSFLAMQESLLVFLLLHEPPRHLVISLINQETWLWSLIYFSLSFFFFFLFSSIKTQLVVLLFFFGLSDLYTSVSSIKLLVLLLLPLLLLYFVSDFDSWHFLDFRTQELATKFAALEWDYCTSKSLLQDRIMNLEIFEKHKDLPLIKIRMYKNKV